MKHFRLGGNLVETRLFMRHPDGDWAGYTYEWNAQRTDATLVQGGKTVAVGCAELDLPERQRLPDVPHGGRGFRARSRGGAAQPRLHLCEHGPHGEPAAHARRDHDVHDAARRSGAAAGDAGPVRHYGAARAARAGVSAHELRQLPPHRAGRRRARWICVTRRCCRARTPAARCRSRATSGSARRRASSRRAARRAPCSSRA